MESSLKVVLDTNIFISALTAFGSSRDFIYSLLQKEAIIIISDFIIAEVEEVLARKKFHDKIVLKELWETIKKDTVIVKVKPIISKIVLRDPKDHPILQTARKGNANLENNSVPSYLIHDSEDILINRNATYSICKKRNCLLMMER